MRIRDEKLKRETKQLERTYKICKQEIEKLNQAMSGNPEAFWPGGFKALARC